jgi:hypothetical protein
MIKTHTHNVNNHYTTSSTNNYHTITQYIQKDEMGWRFTSIDKYNLCLLIIYRKSCYTWVGHASKVKTITHRIP